MDKLMQNSGSQESLEIESMQPERSKHSASDNASRLNQKQELEQIIECESNSGEDIEIKWLKDSN